MWEAAQWIISVGIGGIIAAISQLFFLKPNKRIKEAEAKRVDFEVIKSELEYCKESIRRLYQELGISQEQERNVKKEFAVSETKRYKLKSCISCAHNCKYAKECPVLERQRELEEEWIKESKENESKDKTI